MNLTACLFVSLVLSTLDGVGQDQTLPFPELDALASEYDDRVTAADGPHLAAVAELNKKYLARLELEQKAAQQAGKLDEAMAINEETKTVSSGGEVPLEEDANTPAALKKMHALYRIETGKLESLRDQRIKPLRDDFTKRLDAWVVNLTKEGKLQEAMTVRKFREDFQPAADARNPGVVKTPGPWIDLLKLMELPKHAVKGTWQRRGSAVAVTEPGDCSRAMIPYSVTGNYELQYRAVRMSGKDQVTFILPLTTTQFEMVCGHASGTSFLCRMDGKGVSAPCHVENGQEFDVSVKVLQNEGNVSIAVALDGKRFIDWEGPESKISFNPAWRLPAKDCFGLAALNSVATFKSAKVRTLPAGLPRGRRQTSSTSSPAVPAAGIQLKATDAKLAFTADNRGNLVFDTGRVKGAVTKDGLDGGLKQVTFIGLPVDSSHGMLVPYRFLTPQKRYGFGSWEWPHTGGILNDGAAELRWSASADRPFAFSSTLRWKAADTLDLTLRFTPDTDLEKFELFLGSYFRDFTKATAYVNDSGNGRAGFIEADKNHGGMQLFPKNQTMLSIINDGRWTFPPFPNTWQIRPDLSAVMGFRQEPTTGATVLIMAPPEDCFAISMPEQQNPLGAFYLSLFGKDVKKGQTLTAHTRMTFGININSDQAILKYQQYLNDLRGLGSVVSD